MVFFLNRYILVFYRTWVKFEQRTVNNDQMVVWVISSLPEVLTYRLDRPADKVEKHFPCEKQTYW